jgi:uncharacterized protein with HEPN domain
MPSAPICNEVTYPTASYSMPSGSGCWPAIPWAQIARLRDHLAHRYFDTDHAVLQATVDSDLPELERAVQALAETLPLKEQL